MGFGPAPNHNQNHNTTPPPLRPPPPFTVPPADYGILAGDYLVAVNEIDLVKRLETVPGARAKCDEVRQ